MELTFEIGLARLDLVQEGPELPDRGYDEPHSMRRDGGHWDRPGVVRVERGHQMPQHVKGAEQPFDSVADSHGFLR